MTAERLHMADTDEATVVRRVVDALSVGALVVLPTETVYGLAADAGRPDALSRIYAAKRRDHGKPVAMLADSLATIERFGGEAGAAAARLAARFWPGPLTLVLRCRGAWEGFRIPDFPLTLAVLRGVGGVLRVTSANASGEPPALTADDAMAALGHAVELVVDAGRVPGGTASTVVKVDGDTLTVLRAGPVTREMLDGAVQP